MIDTIKTGLGLTVFMGVVFYGLPILLIGAILYLGYFQLILHKGW